MLGGLGLMLAACDDAQPSSESRAAMVERLADVLPVVIAADAPLPKDREEILRELAPLPAETLLIVYRVEGPGGMQGSLEVLARPGGLRRENWTLTVPLGPEGERRIAGSTIQTPDAIWVEGQDASRMTRSPVGALADAYLELDESGRRAVVDQLRTLGSTLADARQHDDTTPDTVLDIPCHATRVASTTMCIWEATGLPLRYTSDGLRLVAVNVDTQATFGEHAFDLPAPPDTTDPMPFDARAALRRLVNGELGEVAPLLHPGLRLPTAS